MHCGTKARKKSATLGFSAFVKIPCQKIRRIEVPPAIHASSPQERRAFFRSDTPQYASYAPLTHFIAVNAAVEAANKADSRQAAARMCRPLKPAPTPSGRPHGGFQSSCGALLPRTQR